MAAFVPLDNYDVSSKAFLRRGPMYFRASKPLTLESGTSSSSSCGRRLTERSTIGTIATLLLLQRCRRQELKSNIPRLRGKKDPTAGTPRGYKDGDMMTFSADAGTLKEDGSMMSIGELRLNEVKKKQIDGLNNFLKSMHKKQRKRGVAPRMELTERPDNPWRDRYLLCKDCEHRADYEGLEPQCGCNKSTFLEVDMTVPFSRDNVMVTSCEIVQLIREDVWVYKGSDGKYAKCDEKLPGTFPVQVCAVCRKISLHEGRKFRTCETCYGVSYCSDKCFAEHRWTHKASCVIPSLPYRGEWGVRKALRAMRSEVYPMINTWVIKAPIEHRIAWLPPPANQQRGLLGDGQEPKKVRLVGMGRDKKLLPAISTLGTHVKDGQVVLVDQEPTAFRRPRNGSSPDLDPDPELLNMFGMTKEEYLERDAQLRMLDELEDRKAMLALSEASAALTVVEEIKEKRSPLSLPTKLEAGKVIHARTGLRGDQKSTHVVVMPKLMLDEEAIARVEAAVLAPSEERQWPPTRPPWEIPRDPEKVAEQKRLHSEMPLEERKEGVVYPESPVRELAKKHKLQLSEEALQRLEEAATAGAHNVHRTRWRTTPTQKSPENFIT